MEKMDGKTMDIVAENVGKLKELFPEAFTEGKVDFEALKEVLGTFVDDRDERYSFIWNGKSKARMIAQTPSTGTLRPCKEESVDWDATQNIFIEGDNLEVLKLLQKSYHKKVKMIYIDPPYNTGKDFVYKDNFKDNIKNYKEITGQVDGEGRNLSNNPETSGRYHTDWLNMMYPRLKLARNLLKDDGVIFVSIDDGEVANLINICNEIFGEENFINQISLNAKVSAGASGGGEDRKLKKNIEYILMYSKSYSHWEPISPVYKETKLVDYIDQMKKDKKSFKYTNVLYQLDNVNYYKKIKDGEGNDIDIFNVGSYEIKTIKQIASIEGIDEDQVYKKYYDKVMTTTNAQTSIRDRVWDATDSENNMYIAEYVPKSGKNKGEKTKLYFMGKQKVLLIWLKDTSVIIDREIYKREKIGTYWDGFSWINVTKEGNVKYPNGKKPIALIQQFMKLIPNNQSMYVLDFFAGSGSTAHATLQYNQETHSDIHFINIQLPELIEPNTKENKDYIKYLKEEKISTVVTEVSKERIRRAATKIKEDNPDYNGDLGFKAFKLDSTNIKPWEVDFDMTERTLEDFISNIKPDRREEDVLYEILLKYGLDLTLPLTERTIAGQKVFDIGMGALIICLADAISLEVVEGMAKLKEELNPEIMRVVFKDSGFKDDVVKTNAVQILKQAGIVDVRSL
jgi:adenine-specific DNA-methyltransferase